MTETTTLRCELCETPMTAQDDTGGAVRYYFCAGCGRWVASNYSDEMMRRAKSVSVDRRTQPGQASAEELDEKIKARLSRWIAEIDENDPYRTLGLHPSASDEAVRARFHELAMRHHPDRGGDAAQMRRIIGAYERIKNAGKPASAHQCVVKRPAVVRKHATR